MRNPCDPWHRGLFVSSFVLHHSNFVREFEFRHSSFRPGHRPVSTNLESHEPPPTGEGNRTGKPTFAPPRGDVRWPGGIGRRFCLGATSIGAVGRVFISLARRLRRGNILRRTGWFRRGRFPGVNAGLKGGGRPGRITNSRNSNSRINDEIRMNEG